MAITFGLFKNNKGHDKLSEGLFSKITSAHKYSFKRIKTFGLRMTANGNILPSFSMVLVTKCTSAPKWTKYFARISEFTSIPPMSG
jgi:hypothetical protein